MEQNEPKPECGAEVCHECALKRDGDCIGPTTGEIAGAIRVCENKLECDVCPMQSKPCGDLYKLAADRLESQEQTIAAQTARAEQSERERDALLTDFSTIERDGLCEVCSFGDSSQISKEDCMEDCCFNYRTWRGLPQAGEESR